MKSKNKYEINIDMTDNGRCNIYVERPGFGEMAYYSFSVDPALHGEFHNGVGQELTSLLESAAFEPASVGEPDGSGLCKPELLGQIIDVFEDFLEEKNVFIPNPEREDDEDLENGAIIYGSDYDSVSSGIESVLSAWGLL